MFEKKSLVLLGVENQKQKAVLHLEKNQDLFTGRLRIYNFSIEPEGILSIGFHNEKQISKAGLVRISNALYEFKIDSKLICENFSCAVVSTFQGDISPILYGNTNSKNNLEETLSNLFAEEFSSEKTMEEVETILEENKIEYDEKLQKEIDEEIDNEIEKEISKCSANDCRNCKYKRVFFEEKPNLEDDIIQEKQEENETEKTFFEQIKPQIDELFLKNSREEYLQNLIPNSKWVKVDYDSQGDYYILGLIYEEESLVYVVYGVPGVYSSLPPKEIAGKPVWFPLDNENPESFGYWLSYQDANTGESIEAYVE